MKFSWQKHLQRQPNTYTCGPASLRHGLLLFKERFSIRRVARHARCNSRKRWAHEWNLIAAAKKLGFKMFEMKFTTSKLTIATIRYYLKRGCPVLLCVDKDASGPYQHWVAIMHATYRYVWVADSGRTEYPILLQNTWHELMDRLEVRVGDNHHEFCIYPIIKKESK